MATANPNDFLRRLARGMVAEALGDCTDQDLVEQGIAGRDEAAFQAIVSRHGPMVYRVCWRVLQHPQDAEDAFQATFLVLAQKLRAVRKQASLASWLHGVAHRLALKARAQAAARRRRERQASLPDAWPADDLTWAEVRAALDSELNRLPDRWRQPLILCYLEGRTQDQAASQLGWSKTTLRRRLEEARAALGHRLTGRGIVGPAALSAVLVSECVASAAPAPGLVAATVEAAAGAAAGKTAASAEAAALAEGVLKAMFLTRLRMATAVVFLLGLVTAGLGGLSSTTRATAQPESRQAAPPQKDRRPPEVAPDVRLLVEKARELEAAKARHQTAEAALKEAQKKLLEAHERLEEVQDRYATATARRRSKDRTAVSGKLVKVDARENSVRVEHWKEVRGDGRPFTRMNYLAYETFPVTRGVSIMQDNVKTRLADLKVGSRIALGLRGEKVASIIADGGTVWCRLVSANEARNTITVIAGRKDERRVYHLVKETEVRTAGGKPTLPGNLKRGTMLLLTLSVEDARTAIRIEALAPVNEKEE